MKTHARAVVVGGGAVGCSILYHLAKAGWTDVVLLERDELTSGSTWHAAGLLPLFNMSYAVSHIHNYSVNTYEQLEDETGLNAGLSRVGNLRMARTKERMDEYRLYASTADTVGVDYEWINGPDIEKRWPMINAEGLEGAIFHPGDGYINPADLTMAYAKGARQMGATIYRKKQVDAFNQKPNGEWVITGHDLETKEPFEMTAGKVITATGNHAQRTAAMIGCYIPAMPVEHQFVVTGECPTLAAYRAEGNAENPVIRDADAKTYVREERGGWICGP
ncbi:MAG: NAD(P)/FAD-dependent oxidoreductase, partial [Alphaproteobacteria bacterium]